MAQRSWSGNAVPTTITSGIDGGELVFSIVDATGWPAGGTNAFVVVIDIDEDIEEKVLIQSRTGTTLTVAADGRGHDGTTSVAHGAGASIRHCVDAETISKTDAHVEDDTRDDHGQYLNNTRHDIEARHTFGAALGTPADPVAIGTDASQGSGNNPAREDHVHAVGEAVAGPGLGLTAGTLEVKAGTGVEIVGDAVAIKPAYQFESGDLKVSARSSPTTGWLLCDGAAVSRTTQANLFAAIGTEYGPGDGSTTFNVPDFRGRSIFGAGQGAGLTLRGRGDTGGAESVVLTEAQLAEHTHVQNEHTHVQNSHNHTQDPHAHTVSIGFTGVGDSLQNTEIAGLSLAGYMEPATATNQATTATNQNETAVNQLTGANGAHENMSPFGVANVFIKT